MLLLWRDFYKNNKYGDKIYALWHFGGPQKPSMGPGAPGKCLVCLIVRPATVYTCKYSRSNPAIVTLHYITSECQRQVECLRLFITMYSNFIRLNERVGLKTGVAPCSWLRIEHLPNMLMQLQYYMLFYSILFYSILFNSILLYYIMGALFWCLVLCAQGLHFDGAYGSRTSLRGHLPIEHQQKLYCDIFSIVEKL